MMTPSCIVRYLTIATESDYVVLFDTQRPRQPSIEILVENETTELMNNETAQ